MNYELGIKNKLAGIRSLIDNWILRSNLTAGQAGRGITGYNGQTIIEVIVALTMITLFLSGIVVVELYAIKNANYARNKSLATKLARQQLERARVVRDTAGIDGLSVCLSTCYINSFLTPVPVTPTGIYGQSLRIQAVSVGDCPLPAMTVTPIPVSYRAAVLVSWSQGAVNLTPAPQVEMSSCLTDWR